MKNIFLLKKALLNNYYSAIVQKVELDSPRLSVLEKISFLVFYIILNHMVILKHNERIFHDGSSQLDKFNKWAVFCQFIYNI